MTPGDDYAKSKLEVIGSLMTYVICKVKSNSCNPCVCGNVFIVQDWSSEDCWPSVNRRNIFPFQLRYMTWMADEYKCQTKYQGTNMYRIFLTLQQTSAKLPEIYPFFFYKILSFNLKDFTSGIA